jgi:hypothetical protein
MAWAVIVPIVVGDGEVAPAPDEDTATGSLELGPSPGGGLLRVTFDGLPRGVAVAPYAARALAFAATQFGLELPTLEPGLAGRDGRY